MNEYAGIVHNVVIIVMFRSRLINYSAKQNIKIMCLHNVLSIVGFVAALCTYLAFLTAWLPYFMPGSPGL